eukprot:1175836-Prorocentrum_minimum.AAC.1
MIRGTLEKLVNPNKALIPVGDRCDSRLATLVGGGLFDRWPRELHPTCRRPGVRGEGDDIRSIGGDHGCRRRQLQQHVA